MKNNFKERLVLILNGRKKHPWGEALGFTRGTLTRLFNGEIPSAEKLTPICRTENVSLTWLLEGIGEPYMVHHTYTDEETAELIKDHTDDESWQILVLKNQVYPAVILTLPATMQVGKSHIKYTAIEIIAGPAGPETLEAITGANALTQEIDVDEFTMRRLYAGKVSNQEIFGNTETLLYAQPLQPFSGNLPLHHKVAENRVSYIVPELMRKAIFYVEEACLEEGEVLSPEQKSRAITAVYKYMQRTYTTELDKNAVLAILDAI